MMSAFEKFIYHWQQFRQYKKLPIQQRQVVFYSPDAASWNNLRPIIVRLVHFYKHDVAYLTSSDNDRALFVDNDHIHAFNIGKGLIRRWALSHLKARTLVTTTPDIWHFLKKGRRTPHTVYVHPSIISTHMSYPKGALDNFDTVFCGGPHHAAEIRETERLYGLNKKKLIRFGFGKLDVILQEVANDDKKNKRMRSNHRHILVAPSATAGSMTQTVAREVIYRLLDAGYQVTFRPQMSTDKKSVEILEKISASFAENPRFKMEEDTVLTDAFFTADLMISDWSPLALEFAFGLECPVLYINTPKQVSNDEYGQITHVPLEESIRSLIGEVLSPDELSHLPDLARRMIANRYQYIKSILHHREQYVFNIGKSGLYGAKYIDNVLKEPTAVKNG